MSESIGAALNRALRDADRAALRRRPYKDAIEHHEQSSRRIILRDAYGRPTAHYGTSRLGRLTYSPAHSYEFTYLGDSKRHTGHRPATVADGAGGSRTAQADQLADFARYPTARALRRIEAAEQALAAAQAELKAATRAAFIHGRPVPLSAVRANQRARDKLAELLPADEGGRA